jgi:protein-tyrosine phosphatase
MAEALFRELVKDRPDYQVSSAGVAAGRGQTASQHTADILAEKGISVADFRSQPVTDELVRESTHIFAMAGHHLALLDLDFPEATNKSYLVSEFTADDDLRGEDVHDPIGMGRRAYDHTRSSLEKMLPSVLAFIDQTWKPESKEA